MKIAMQVVVLRYVRLQSCFCQYVSYPEQLKFLYVAVTRARKNLWIVDCSEIAEPMRVCFFIPWRAVVLMTHPDLDILGL